METKVDSHTFPTLRYLSARAIPLNKLHNLKLPEDIQSCIDLSPVYWKWYQLFNKIRLLVSEVDQSETHLFRYNEQDLNRAFQGGKKVLVAMLLLGGVNHFLKGNEDYVVVKTIAFAMIAGLALSANVFVDFTSESERRYRSKIHDIKALNNTCCSLPNVNGGNEIAALKLIGSQLTHRHYKEEMLRLLKELSFNVKAVLEKLVPNNPETPLLAEPIKMDVGGM